MAVPIIVSSTNNVETGTPTGSVSAAAPSGATAGDYVYALAFALTGDGTSTIVPPSGWEKIQTHSYSYAGLYPVETALYRTTKSLTSSEVWSYTGGTPYGIQVQLYRVSGGQSDSSVKLITTSGSTTTFPSITTTNADNLVLLLGQTITSGNSSEWSLGIPSGTTGLSTNELGFGAAYFTQSAPGATGVKTVPQDPSQPFNEGIPCTAFTVAISPTGGVAPEAYSGPVFKSVGSATITSGTAGITPTMPSWVAGDRLIWYVETANQAVTTPAGLTVVTGSPQSTGTAAATTATRLSVYTREMVAGDTAVAFADPGDHIASYVINVGPCDIAYTNGSVAATASTSAVFGVTTEKHTLVVAACSVVTDIATARFSSWSTNLTERADGATTQGNGGGIGIATAEIMDESGLFDGSATLATSSQQARLTIALKNKPVVIVPSGPVVDTGPDTATWSIIDPLADPLQANDLVVLRVGYRGSGVLPDPLGGGWFRATQQNQGDYAEPGIASAAVFYKTYQTGDLDIPSATSVWASGVTDARAINTLAVAYRRSDGAASALDVVSSATEPAASDRGNSPSITTTGPNRLLLGLCVESYGAEYPVNFQTTVPSGTSYSADVRTDFPTNKWIFEGYAFGEEYGSWLSLGVAHALKVTAGATGVLNVGGWATNSRPATAMLAFGKQAAGAVTPTRRAARSSFWLY